MEKLVRIIEIKEKLPRHLQRIAYKLMRKGYTKVIAHIENNRIVAIEPPKQELIFLFKIGEIKIYDACIIKEIHDFKSRILVAEYKDKKYFAPMFINPVPLLSKKFRYGDVQRFVNMLNSMDYECFRKMFKFSRSLHSEKEYEEFAKEMEKCM